MSKPITDERLAELKAGLEGVTKGPWVAHGGMYYHMWAGDVFARDADRVPDATPIAKCVPKKPDRPFLDDLEPLAWERKQQPIVEANAAHIANCDPHTIASLIARLELAEGRS